MVVIGGDRWWAEVIGCGTCRGGPGRDPGRPGPSVHHRGDPLWSPIFAAPAKMTPGFSSLTPPRAWCSCMYQKIRKVKQK